MKRIFLLIIVLFVQSVISQSRINESEALAATCKIWGYLKYYHPEAASGKLDWDKQLLEILPRVEKANNKEQFSSIMENWIDSLGEIKKIAPIIPSKEIKYFDKNFDLSWTQNQNLFSKSLSKKLKFIEENRFQGEQYYVSTFNAGNVFAKNEKYSNYLPNNKDMRLLAFFMYWNLIEYFYPYKYLMDKKWDLTLKEMLPAFVNAQDEDEFYMAMKKLTVRLNDSHAIFFKYPDPNSESKEIMNYFPANCKIIDEKLVVTEILSDSLAKADTINVGDVITKINDKTIKEIIAENREVINASNDAFYLVNLELPILSGSSEYIKLEFLDNGRYKSRNIKWYGLHDAHRNNYIKKDKKQKFKILTDNIGYVDMGILKVRDVPAMIEELKTTQAIIFDIRNYPKGTYKEIADFLNDSSKEFVIYTKPDLSYPGRFWWSPPGKCGKENPEHYKGKVVVLVNELTLSQAEWTAMCFKTTGRTTIIGSQTAGADGNVSDVDMIKAFYTRFTGIGVYYPDKSETQRIGIVPDIEVKVTIKGIQEGKDEILDRAVNFIRSEK